MKTSLRLFTACFVGMLLSFPSIGQQAKNMNSAEIYAAIEKFAFLGNALYVAAHPDDENTRMISYLSNHVKANTAYLSLTRGGGGQNLIGTELKEFLGVLRTQELQMARSVDGGQQFFTRAIDFSYSKHPDESFNIWDKNKVLADAVWVIRKFRPDILINRFDHDSAGRTHGHHTASALVSLEAFDLAGDPNAFPEQLKYVRPWQPSRVLFNTSWWFYGSRENFEKADKTNLLTVDVGTYYPLRGKSNNEIAAESRSMHRCQGFGSSGTRGSQIEYLELLRGDLPTDKSNPFEGIVTDWSRVEGGKTIKEMIEKLLESYDFNHPEKSLKGLVDIYNALDGVTDTLWRKQKEKELKDIIASCAGLYLEFDANESSASPGQTIKVGVECTNRSSEAIFLNSLTLYPSKMDTTINQEIGANQSEKFTISIGIPKNAPFTSPYWLNKKGSLGTYNVSDPMMIGLPETPAYLKGDFDITIHGRTINFRRDVLYKYADPAVGEIFEPFQVVPRAFVNIEKDVYIFDGSRNKEMLVTVTSGEDDLSGTLDLNLKDGWTSEPKNVVIEKMKKGEKRIVPFTIIPPQEQSVLNPQPSFTVNGKSYSQAVTFIDYNHIPKQTVLQEASTKLVNIQLEKRGSKVGYLMGAGDKVPESLREIGYDVTLIEPGCSMNEMKSFDAIISGIRAYNTISDISFFHDRVMDYVEAGGTYIVQYNTSRRLKANNIGPFPIKLSRDRVTVEEAEVRFLAPDHPVLNYPNKITSDDFKDWVSERGLYFASEWDERYTPIFSSNDPGEDPKNGGMLIAKHGKGHFIFSGYSWFRELPAGVPGAYRIFANMVSIGKEVRP